jgi:hypothetical protein
VISATHWLFCNAWATMRTLNALLSTATNKSGAKDMIHLSHQNQVSSLDPTLTEVEASNNTCSILSPLLDMADHERLGSTWASQDHRKHNACPGMARSSTPSLPSSIDRVTLGQATMQRPPEAEDVPHQMNPRRILSMS